MGLPPRTPGLRPPLGRSRVSNQWVTSRVRHLVWAVVVFLGGKSYQVGTKSYRTGADNCILGRWETSFHGVQSTFQVGAVTISSGCAEGRLGRGSASTCPLDPPTIDKTVATRPPVAAKLVWTPLLKSIRFHQRCPMEEIYSMQVPGIQSHGHCTVHQISHQSGTFLTHTLVRLQIHCRQHWWRAISKRHCVARGVDVDYFH